MPPIDQMKRLIRVHKPFGVSDDEQTIKLAESLLRAKWPEKISILCVNKEGTVDTICGYPLQAAKDALAEEAAEVIAGIPIVGGGSFISDQFVIDSVEAIECVAGAGISWTCVFPEDAYHFP
jgi:hypothetical protein